MEQLTPFQKILIPVMVLFLTLTLAARVRGWLNLRETVLLAGLWISAGVTIAWPRITTKIAKLLGISTGAHLVLYLTVLGVMVGFFFTYRALRQTRRELTVVIRHMALLNTESDLKDRRHDRAVGEDLGAETKD